MEIQPLDNEQEKALTAKFENDVTAAVESYLEAEEEYGDAAVIEINPETLAVSLLRERPQIEDQSEEQDYVDVMDLVKMDASNPGSWIPDTEAINGLAMEFC